LNITIAKDNVDLSITDTKKLIKSKYHEERFLGLIILVNKYDLANKQNNLDKQEKLFKIYISHFKYINNWNLVDASCPHIVGKHLMNRDRKILMTWAKSDHLWTKRIAIITNWWFIRNGDLKEVFKISKILLNDKHDLIHKAVGWMLREAAIVDSNKMKIFLKTHYKKMPRTMLRYAIEKFTKTKRQNI